MDKAELCDSRHCLAWVSRIEGCYFNVVDYRARFIG